MRLNKCCTMLAGVIACCLWAGCTKIDGEGELPTSAAPQQSATADEGQEIQDVDSGTVDAETEESDKPADPSVDESAEDSGSTGNEEEVTAAEVRTETAEAIAAAEEFAAEKRKEYRERMKDRLDKIEEHFTALRKDLANVEPAVSKNVKDVLAGMEEKMAGLRKEIADEGADSEEAWQEFTTAMENAVTELEGSAEEIRQQLTPDESDAAAGAAGESAPSDTEDAGESNETGDAGDQQGGEEEDGAANAQPNSEGEAPNVESSSERPSEPEAGESDDK